MDEQVFHESIPQGSPILAFGKVAGPKKSGAFLVAGAVVASLLFLGFFLRTVFSPTIPIPKNVALLTFITKKTSLPNEAPAVWRSTQSVSGLPILAGYSLDEKGERIPFAVSVRKWSNGTSWLWKLSQDKELPYNLIAPGDVADRADYFKGFWLRIWPKRLLPEIPNLEDGASFGGPITNEGWLTDLASPENVKTPSHAVGPNYFNLTALPLAWDVFQPILGYFNHDLNLSARPSTVSWFLQAPADLSLALSFDELTPQIKAETASSAGLFDKITTPLPDGSLTVENKLPLLTVSASTAQAWEAEKKIAFLDNTVFLGETSAFPPLTVSEKCNGDFFAVLDQQSLQRLIAGLDLDYIFAPKQAVLLKKGDRTLICW